jgi:hypothetical protein
MKESLRRVILFTVIVVTGSAMILFDVPLILMVPLILAVGFIILLLLGAVTVADFKSVFTRKKLKNPKKISLIQQLDEMKFFEKKSAQPDKKSTPSPKKDEGKKSIAKKTGTGSHLRSFFTSLGSLRTVLRERSKHAKNAEHIDQLLDKTVSEKVKSSPLAGAGKGIGTKIPPPATGSGSDLKDKDTDQDPFLSLSGDEFDASLLDGLEDQETPGSPSSLQVASPDTPFKEPGLNINQPEIPIPSLDTSSEAGDILKDNEESLEEFKGLEGGESIDQDFSDLENINLDDIDLDSEIEEETPAVKTEWVASDAPKGADLSGDEISTRDDISSFAGGPSGSDADMLSSLAADVKHVTKEKNTSLLRDLKDFKAPATEIEHELTDLYSSMKNVQASGKKGVTSRK